jgi:hypothetical protein
MATTVVGAAMATAVVVHRPQHVRVATTTLV